jgi:short-subunit dehydrogenase
MAVVVITGASSGIGEASAKALARRGHALVLAARRTERLRQVAHDIDAADRILIVPADVGEPAALKALADAAGERFGVIDVWINNAGVTHPEAIPWWNLEPEQIETILRVNLLAPMLSVRAALPWLKKAKRPHIINIGSVAGFIGVKGIYSATKFGLRGHTEALRRELADQGIGVSMVSPGFIRTEMTLNQGIARKMPGPEVIANAIVQLVQNGPRRNVVVPGRYNALIWLNTLFPALIDYGIARHRKRLPTAK